MRFFSLGSGSSGNGFLLDTGEVAYLIDCGIAARTCQTSIRELAVQDRLAGIVVSHEHVDHVRSIPSVTRRTACPIITTAGTFTALRSGNAWQQRSSGDRHADSGVEITFVGVSHDAAEPCGFTIDYAGTRIAVFTDLGHVTEDVLVSLVDADIVVLEANYDRRMLQYGPYPMHLKRRIQGPTGHLSNDDCASALVATVTSRTRAIWLAHLSHNNNTPDLAVQTVTEALQLGGHEVPVAALPRFERAEITSVPSAQLHLGI
jgi:phosphoribosyl 1,2-cyclic phosphodiesterase